MILAQRLTVTFIIVSTSNHALFRHPKNCILVKWRVIMACLSEYSLHVSSLFVYLFILRRDKDSGHFSL